MGKVQPLSEQEYIAINIDLIKKISGPLPFDVYIQRTETSYTKLFPMGEVADPARVEQYRSEKGIETFSVMKSDYKSYLVYIEKLASKAFDGSRNVDLDKAVPLLGELVNSTMVDILVTTDVDEASARAASQTVKGCIKALNQEPKRFAEILRLVSRHPYAIKHSVSVSMFSLLLAKAMKFTNEKSLAIVGMGAFLHDVGMAQLPVDAEDLQDMTPDQWKDVKEHPQIGKKILDSVPSIPPEVRQIILQHHEQPNGMGYPNRLNGPQIYPPAKIVAVADAFATYLSSRPYREKPLAPAAAIELMREDVGKFDTRLLEELSKLFVAPAKKTG